MILEVRYSAPLPVQAAAARLRRLLVEPRASAYALSATQDGESVLMRAGIAGFSKQVAVRALEPIYRPDRVTIPLRWVATGVAGELFPSLDGNLELRAVDDETTELALIGSYRPPLGRSGEVIDQLVMSGVARRTLKSFLTRLGTAIAEPRPAPQQAPMLQPEPQADK